MSPDDRGNRWGHGVDRVPTSFQRREEWTDETQSTRRGVGVFLSLLGLDALAPM